MPVLVPVVRARSRANMAENGTTENFVSDFKTRISDLVSGMEVDDDFIQDRTLIRFLKGQDWNLVEAEKQLRATVKWRQEKRPQHAQCGWCRDMPGYHSVRQVGFDLYGRPVIYSNFAQAAVSRYTVEDATSHIMYLIENAKRSMSEDAQSWVFVIDCTGMALPSCNPKLGHGVTQMLSNHYPERLHQAICINHSPVFKAVWKAIKIFLHLKTASKLKLANKKNVDALFGEMFTDEMSIWLKEEIRMNRRTPLPLSQRQFWKHPEDSTHDPRGSPSYVHEYIDTYLAREDLEGSAKHKPHPNIIDTLKGTIKEYRIPETPDILRQKLVTQASGDCEDIADEFQLSEDVCTLLPGNI